MISVVDIGAVFEHFSLRDSLLPVSKKGALESFIHFIEASKQEDFKNIFLNR